MAIEGFTPYKEEDAEKYNRLRWWLGLTWGDVLDRDADVYPNRVALVDDTTRLTYSQLREKTNRLAIGLMKLGINNQDFVLLQSPNWGEFVYSFFALQKIGAIPVLLLPRHAFIEINRFANLTQARAWIVPTRYRKIDYLPIIDEVLKVNPQLEFVISIRGGKTAQFVSLEELIEDADLSGANLRRLADRRPDPVDVGEIGPTGGTTGLPKAVPRTRNSDICNAEYLVRAHELTLNDVVLVTAPVTHRQGFIGGFASAFFAFARLVLLDSTDPADICRTVEKQRVTFIPTVPPLAISLVNFEHLKKYDLSSLRLIHIGGAAGISDLIKIVWDKIGCQVVNGLGSTEGSQAQTRLGDDIDTILNTVGRPTCPYDTFKIIDQDERELPPNAEGELVTKGPGIFTGYFKSDNTEVFTKDGFYKTGDLAKIDDAGNIVMTGRIKDIIRRGSESISATEIEELIRGYPAVQDVAVIGMPDEKLGERVCAYIQPTPGTKIAFEEIISFLKGKGASVLQLPERIECIEQIPVIKAGKVDKEVLREDIKRRLGIMQ